RPPLRPYPTLFRSLPHHLRHGQGRRSRHGDRPRAARGEVRRAVRRLAPAALTVALIPVDEALERLLGNAERLPAEPVAIADAAWRVLAAPLTARRTQPPFPASAMDGYAVRADDIATLPAILDVVGEAPAGRPFGGTVGAGQAVRIFTGAPLPEGADTVLLQEDTRPAGP